MESLYAFLVLVMFIAAGATIALQLKVERFKKLLPKKKILSAVSASTVVSFIYWRHLFIVEGETIESLETLVTVVPLGLFIYVFFCAWAVVLLHFTAMWILNKID